MTTVDGSKCFGRESGRAQKTLTKKCLLNMIATILIAAMYANAVVYRTLAYYDAQDAKS